MPASSNQRGDSKGIPVAQLSITRRPARNIKQIQQLTKKRDNLRPFWHIFFDPEMSIPEEISRNFVESRW